MYSYPKYSAIDCSYIRVIEKEGERYSSSELYTYFITLKAVKDYSKCNLIPGKVLHIYLSQRKRLITRLTGNTETKAHKKKIRHLIYDYTKPNVRSGRGRR